MIGIGLGIRLSRAKSVLTPAALPAGVLLGWGRAEDLALADGARVSSWPGSHDTLVASGAARPEYRTHALGRPCVKGNGTDRSMQGAVNITGGRWAYAVATPEYDPSLTRAADPSASQPPAIFASTRGLIGLNEPTTDGLIATGDTGSGGLGWIKIYGVSEYERDGVESYASPGVGLDGCEHVYEWGNSGGFGGSPLSILRDRDQTAAGSHWHGSISEYVVLSSSATADHRALVKRYLNSRRRRRLVSICGDSIAAGFGVTRAQAWVDQVRESVYRGAVNFSNVAVPGHTIPDARTYDGPKIHAYGQQMTARRVLCIAIGTNDIGTASRLIDGGNPATAWTNLQALIADYRAAWPGVRVIVQTLLPRNDAGMSAGYETRRGTLNASILAGASSLDYTVVDAGADTLDLGGGASLAAPGSAAFLDGVHPSSLGQGRLKTLWQTAIAAQL